MSWQKEIAEIMKCVSSFVIDKRSPDRSTLHASGKIAYAPSSE